MRINKIVCFNNNISGSTSFFGPLLSQYRTFFWADSGHQLWPTVKIRHGSAMAGGNWPIVVRRYWPAIVCRH